MVRIAIAKQFQFASEPDNHHIVLNCGHTIIADGPAEIGQPYSCPTFARLARPRVRPPGTQGGNALLRSQTVKWLSKTPLTPL